VLGFLGRDTASGEVALLGLFFEMFGFCTCVIECICDQIPLLISMVINLSLG
jgi:hypothetical protein